MLSSSITEQPKKRVFIVLLLAIVCLLVGLRGQVSADSREYMVKAAFLYNFGKFTMWPQNTFVGIGASIEMCVTRREPFGDALNILKYKTVQGRPLKIRVLRETSDIRSCHILFVSSHEKKKYLTRILASLRNRSVLSVGESEDFLRAGGIVNLTIKDNKVRFQVNIHAARQANLAISSKLLKLAEIVGVPAAE